MKKTILLVFAWLFAVNVFAFVALNRFNLNPDTAYTWITPQGFPTEQSWDIVDMHNRWDSYWYLDVVENGYHLRADNTLSDVVFFPLYPVLIKIFGTLIGGRFVLAGWILSMTFLIFAVVVFRKLLRSFHPSVDPDLPILLMLVFPTAFFFNALYTESLFLLLTLATFYATFQRRFLLAGVISFFGALTHSNGMFLALPIVWEVWRIYGWKSIFTARIAPVFFAPFGTMLFVAYDYYRFGDPMLFFKIQSSWGRSFSINWEHFSLFSHPSIVNMCIDGFLAVFIIGATYMVYRRLSALYAVFMSLTLFAAFSSGTLMSVGRYSLVMFPLFILLATVKNETVRYAWMFASTLFLALDIILFVNNYWAG